MISKIVLFTCVASTLGILGATRDLSCGSSTHFTIGFTDTKEIICATTHITLEPNTTVRYIDSRDRDFNVLEFYGCHIHTFPKEVFLQFDNLKKIKMTGNDVRQIVDHSFEKAFSLKELNMNRNKLEEITRDTFKGASKLTFLSLEHNNIRSVSILAFDTLHSLEVLYLAYNMLTSIQIGLFAPLVNLREVYLYNNKIVQIHPKAFWHNRALEILDLEGNFLAALDLHVNSRKMNVLDLTNNDIVHLSLEGNQKNSTVVRKVLASNNRIVSVKLRPGLGTELIDVSTNRIKTFTNISAPDTPLRTLNLAFNPIEVVDTVGQMRHLHHLDLSYTGLDLGNSSFGSFGSLSVLYLKGLSLSEVPLNPFLGLDGLQILNLQDNELEVLDYEGLVTHLPGLSQLSLQTYGFSCGFLVKFYDFMKKSNISLVHDMEFTGEGFNLHPQESQTIKMRKDCENYTLTVKKPVVTVTHAHFEPGRSVKVLVIPPSNHTTTQTLSSHNPNYRYYTFKLVLTLLTVSMIICIVLLLNCITRCHMGTHYVKLRSVILKERASESVQNEFSKV